jgi:thiol-disulfide isomerase/thioredoxin
MKQWALIILCMLTLAADAQNKIVSGTLQGYAAGSIVYLKRFNGSNITVIDSATIDKAGKFVFANTKYPKFGLHQFVAGQYTVAFPMPKNDMKIEIETSFDKMKEGVLTLKNSTELIAYKEVSALNKTIKEWKEAHLAETRAMNRFDKKHIAKTNEQNAKFFKQIKQYNESLNALATKYAGTYAAEVLVPLYKTPAKEFSVETDTMYDSPAAYYHYHFFDMVNFKEEGTAYNPALEEKILDYIKQYVAPSAEGIKEAIDIIVRKATANITVKEFVVSYLLDLATSRNDMEIAEYLFNNYYSEGCEANIKPEVATIIEGIKRLSPGSPAPDIELIDLNSQRVKLSEVKNKKVIMVYFWSSGCGYCKEATPKLKKLYAETQSKGLEIFAISLDQDYAAWSGYVEQNELKWINVSELKGWKTRAVESYAISGTPSYILIDGNHKMISRQTGFESAEKAVKEALGL